MHKTEIFERAFELCGYTILHIRYKANRLVLFAEGFIPGNSGRFYWTALGHCFRKRDRKRMPQYDLPIQSAEEQIRLEDFTHVCR